MNDNARVARVFVDAMNAGNLEALDQLFTDDVVLEWPQSNEKIVGNADRREIYSRFPVLPTITNPRFVETGDLMVLEADLDYGDGNAYQTVFIFRMRDGLIAHETAYWAQPFPAAEWRADRVQPIRAESTPPQ
ncbi:MAG TPA: nuclear transport factor 2 family protein [Acidimicrobiia bacterium]